MHTHTLATHGLEVRRQLVAGLGPQLGGGARAHVALQALEIAAQRHAVDQDLRQGGGWGGEGDVRVGQEEGKGCAKRACRTTALLATAWQTAQRSGAGRFSTAAGLSLSPTARMFSWGVPPRSPPPRPSPAACPARRPRRRP